MNSKQLFLPLLIAGILSLPADAGGPSRVLPAEVGKGQKVTHVQAHGDDYVVVTEEGPENAETYRVLSSAGNFGPFDEVIPGGLAAGKPVFAARKVFEWRVYAAGKIYGPYDAASRLDASPETGAWTACAEKNGRFYLYRGGPAAPAKREGPFDRVDALILSADGKAALAAWARDGESFVDVGGRRYGPGDANEMEFAHALEDAGFVNGQGDLPRFRYIRDGAFHAVIGNREYGPFTLIEPFMDRPGRLGGAFAAFDAGANRTSLLVPGRDAGLLPEGFLSVDMENGGNTVVVTWKPGDRSSFSFDGKIWGPFEDSLGGTVSLDNDRIAVVGTNGSKSVLVTKDGTYGPLGGVITETAFSPDGGSLWFILVDGRGARVTDGRAEFGPYAGAVNLSVPRHGTLPLYSAVGSLNDSAGDVYVGGSRIDRRFSPYSVRTGANGSCGYMVPEKGGCTLMLGDRKLGTWKLAYFVRFLPGTDTPVTSFTENGSWFLTIGERRITVPRAVYFLASASPDNAALLFTEAVRPEATINERIWEESEGLAYGGRLFVLDGKAAAGGFFSSRGPDKDYDGHYVVDGGKIAVVFWRR